MILCSTGRQRKVALLFLGLILLANLVQAGFWNNNNKQQQLLQQQDSNNDDKDAIPGVPFLIESLGKELYRAVDRPKYKFALYMTIGKLPDEASFVTMLNMVCNLLYSLAVLGGFVFLPRGYMLVGAVVTLFIGPALILILIGILAVSLAAFTVYPMASVATMWLVFFLTSQLAQVLGRKLGLDQDKDGDVDWLDFVHYLGNTTVGKYIGLDKLHQMLKDANMDPFQEIHRRLDEIEKLSSGRATTNKTK